jgi:cytochrome c peroxidase
MFPVQPHEEMSGEPGDNAIADAAAELDFPMIWDLLAARLKGIPDYVERFRQAFGVSRDEITFAHAANAIAAFIIEYGRVLETPFARYAQGDVSALSPEAASGAEIFFGRGGCAECHAGPLFSDMAFHAIALPQVGPGKGDGGNGSEDFGLERETGEPADRYKFRTPILLNVAHTAPYGHAGQYATLEHAIGHHTAPLRALYRYRCGLEDAGGQLIMPSRPDLDGLDCRAQRLPSVRRAIAGANELDTPPLSYSDVLDLVQFLDEGLTDGRGLTRLLTHLPAEVPSGLPVD